MTMQQGWVPERWVQTGSRIHSSTSPSATIRHAGLPRTNKSSTYNESNQKSSIVKKVRVSTPTSSSGDNSQWGEPIISFVALMGNVPLFTRRLIGGMQNPP